MGLVHRGSRMLFRMVGTHYGQLAGYLVWAIEGMELVVEVGRTAAGRRATVPAHDGTSQVQRWPKVGNDKKDDKWTTAALPIKHQVSITTTDEEHARQSADGSGRRIVSHGT